MAYEPTNWKKDDVITSAKLNKLEQGVAGADGVLVAHIVMSGSELPEIALDKTWQEIHDAPITVVYFHHFEEEWYEDKVSFVFKTSAEPNEFPVVGDYRVFVLGINEDGNEEQGGIYVSRFKATSPDEYPVLIMG